MKYETLAKGDYTKLNDIPVSELEGISTRARNVLASLPYYLGGDVKAETVGDIIDIGARAFLGIPGFGKKSLSEIREAIRKAAIKHSFAIPDGLLEVSK